jgi:hypothetical protein
MAFISGYHHLTGSPCKLRANTEGPKVMQRAREKWQLVRCAFFEHKLQLPRAVEFYAFAPLEALSCVRPMPFLSGCHFLTGWMLT